LHVFPELPAEEPDSVLTIKQYFLESPVNTYCAILTTAACPFRLVSVASCRLWGCNAPWFMCWFRCCI